MPNHRKVFTRDAAPEKETETVFHDDSRGAVNVDDLTESLVRRLGLGRDMARSYAHKAIEDGSGTIVWRPTTSSKPER